MALIIGERVQDDINRARWRATDAITGAVVAVTVSLEALSDKGEAACLSKAIEKYNGSGSRVDVTTGDF
jgi:hypothetical protein